MTSEAGNARFFLFMVSIYKDDFTMKVLSICEKNISKDYRVVDLDCLRGHTSLLRIFIERNSLPPISTGSVVSIQDCVNVSQMLGSVSELENLFPGRFNLEVSSPGADRRLRLQSDFKKVIGSNIKVRLLCSDGKTKNISGRLCNVNDEGIVLLVAEEERNIVFGDIRRATLLSSSIERGNGYGI